MAGVAILAHCGSNWLICDVGTTVLFILLLGFMVWGQRKLAQRGSEEAANRSRAEEEEDGERPGR